MIRVKDLRASNDGFTLIELLIVMSVMLILMTLAVPQLLKLRKQANENSAIQALGGNPKSGAPTAQGAQFLDDTLSVGQKAGYTFAITGCTKGEVNNQDMYTSYQVTAVPQATGKTGDRGFCSDENNVIRADPTGGTNCTQPIQ